MATHKILLGIASVIFSTHLIAQCDGFSQSVTGTDPICHDFSDGSVSVVIEGGTAPFSIEIRDEDGILLNPEGESETGFMLIHGWYYSYIIDDEGCELYDSVYLTNPPPLVIESSTTEEPSDIVECDGSITINEVSGDYELLSFIWSPDPDDISGVGANVFPDACPGTYNVLIGTDEGCTLSDSFELGVGLSITEEMSSYIIVPQTKPSELIISINDNSHNYLSIDVFNMNGQLLQTFPLQNGLNYLTIAQQGCIMYRIRSQNQVVSSGTTFIH